MIFFQMIWEPYESLFAILPEYCRNGHDIWRSTSPLICFHIVEWHLTSRVMRQFGMKQFIPENCDTEQKLHAIDLRNQHWRSQIEPYILRWFARREFIVFGAPVDSHGDTAPDYMPWYLNITRRYITREGASFGQAVFI